MKAKSGDYLLWNGELAEVIGEINSHAVVIELIENRKCPKCNEDLGKYQYAVIDSSPYFQECAKPINTIK